jgi:HEAT repeats/PBS lyase HEAT-like repeat
MRKWHRLLAALLAVAALGGLVWLVSRPREPEPLYRGKPLSYWLQGFSPGNPPSQKGEVQPTYAEAESAFAYYGTNAIPALLRILATPDHPLKDKFFALVRRQHFIHITQPLPYPAGAAARGFQPLGTNAAPAVPQLMQIYERHPSVMSQQVVPAILAQIGPSAKAAVPLLVRATTNDDAYVRNNAVYALGQIGGEPALIVPALTECLADTFDNTRANAADALATFGTNARPAVPALLKLLVQEETNAVAHPKPPAGPGTFSDGRFNTVWGPSAHKGKTPSGPPGMWTIDVIGPVTKALKAIDPEAAAKAGIQ